MDRDDIMNRCCFNIYEESAELTNCMQDSQFSNSIRAAERSNISATDDAALLPILEMQRDMEKNAEKQTKFVDILSQLFDTIVSDNDSRQVTCFIPLFQIQGN
jgi:hypothetical protein